MKYTRSLPNKNKIGKKQYYKQVVSNLTQPLMFWNKKKKSRITEEDKVWVDEDLKWLRAEFGEEHFMEIQTVTPTKKFYNRTFDGTKKEYD